MGTRGRPQGRPALVFERVVDAVKKQIAAGKLKPGDSLPSVEQPAAAHSAGVSSVREALRVLGATRVVRIEHGRGSFVAEPPPPPPELRATSPSRRRPPSSTPPRRGASSSPSALRSPASAASSAEVVAIKKAARRMAADLRSERDWLKADVSFHEAVCEAAHNDVLAHMFASVGPLLLDSRRESMRDAALTRRAAESFSRLSRNGAGARRLRG